MDFQFFTDFDLSHGNPGKGVMGDPNIKNNAIFRLSITFASKWYIKL
jgi:hypothetical protein